MEFGAGFYFDGAAGTAMDGDPTNNTGDLCENISFAVSISLQHEWEQALGGAYDITPTIVLTPDGLTPDGLTGSGTAGVLQTIATTPQIALLEMEAESVNAGENGDIAYGPEALSFSLTDSLTGDPDTEGYWTDPTGNQMSGDLFVQSISPEGTYIYFVDGNCSDASAELGVAFDQSLAADSYGQGAEPLVLYPNPVGDRLHLSIPESVFVLGNTTLHIYSIAGQMVHSAPVQDRENMVDVGILGAGSYLVEIHTRGERVAGSRVVVSR